MSDDYGFGGKRNKKRDKFKKKRENPYKSGGRFRAVSSVSETDNASKKVTNLKKAKNKKKSKNK
jgi:hypothetical protein